MQMSSTGWRRQWSQHRRYNQSLQKEKTQELISERSSAGLKTHETRVQWLKHKVYMKPVFEVQT